ncbi:MAG: GNAT family N-acetyltransferase [Clostridia bacterium]|nr:GNAT family N-acetyltransferase [Clostridia bacterium]
MSDIILVRPDETMLDEIAAYREAMLAAEDSFDGCGGLEDYESPAAWLQHVRDMENPETCPPHLVTATIYAAVCKTDYGMVGMIDLRHRLNDFLAEYGGHIGYSVRPDERRKGYAKQMLALALDEAKKRGINRVLVTCDEKNAASARTILANGGVFERNAWLEDEKQTVRRYWINV